jgi:hypothetical protein
MAFKHIQASRLSFLLASDGIPSGLLVNGENIPVGSLSIDRVAGKLYILRANLAWQEIAGGSGGATPIFEELLTASTSAPYTYNLGFTPTNGSLQVFVNGQLAIPAPTAGAHYAVSGLTITWLPNAPYPIDPMDQLVAYYETTDI